MSDYTPTTDEIEESFVYQQYDTNGRFDTAEAAARSFDRWLAAEIRKAKAEGVREAADAFEADPQTRDPLRLNSDWLRNRAQQLTEES